MRPVWFVICFSLGVGLMVFSGYLPQSAKARGGAVDSETGSGHSESRLHDPFESITLRAPADYQSGPNKRAENAPSVATELPPAANRQDMVLEEPSPPPSSDAPQQPPMSDQRSTAPPVAQGPGPTEPAGLGTPDQDSALPVDGSTLNGTVEQPPAAEPTPPLADAGPDRVVWIGWDELTLDGSGSSGLGLTYQWKQLSGPVPLVIANDRQATTTARGLLTGEALSWRNITYKFELTVTDAGGQHDTDTVLYTVKSAPALSIKPPGERRFEIRDGYELAHYFSWVTNPETLESVFEIASENELTFTRVGGGASYTLGGGLEGKRYVYQVVVYARPDEAASWIEFLVDTDEKIPAIVQLGVTWESR